MSFSFNFFPEESGNSNPEPSGTQPTKLGGSFAFAKQLPFTDFNKSTLHSVVNVDGFPLKKYIINHDAITGLDVDLRPLEYEGGAKTWECTIDLLHYLTKNPDIVNGKRVLDLGCGSGLVGCLSLLQKAAHCVFADYNESVLNSITMPNVAGNCSEQTSNASFISGSWESMLEQLESNDSGPIKKSSVDLLLMSETLYRVESYPVLCALLNDILSPNGECLVASKRYYYGVGGGTKSFIDFASTKGFVITTVAVFEDGRSMIRDILHMKRS